MTPLDQWPASVWVGLGLAPFAATLLYGFVRDSKSTSAVGIAAAIAGHLALLVWVPHPEPSAPAEPRPPELELYDVPEAPILEPEPEPEPEPELPVPEVAEPIAPAEPEPEPKPKPKRRRRSTPRSASEAPPSAEPPAGPKRFDMSQLNAGTNSGVTVHAGSGGGSTLDGDPKHRGRGKAKARPAAPAAPAEPKAKGGRGWAPASQVFVQKLPVPRSVPKRQCPATKNGVEGTVFLKVQVRRDGTVRKVKVVRGIGHGCDALAAAALRNAKFKPALSDSNKAVDFEIRYEYVFRLAH